MQSEIHLSYTDEQLKMALLEYDFEQGLPLSGMGPEAWEETFT
jgi:hypothetical protein